jgi:hypothetical protein
MALKLSWLPSNSGMSRGATLPNGLVVIVFDEATASTLYHDGGPVLWAAQGPQVQPGVYGGAFTHYSFLRTMEDGFRLGGYVGNAAVVKPVNNIWR